MSFWNKLNKPFFVMAPMADVTDAPFRRLIARESAHMRPDGTMGGPDVMWTEFVSADGLIRATEEGKKKLLADLIYTEEERPIVAQLFSSNPEYMEQAAALVHELGFDGIDINMGCPDKSIEKQGCGAAMIRNPRTAVAVIEAALRGGKGLPVSVKTRVGYNRDEMDTWLPHLLSTDIAALTVHARTRKEMSKVPAVWERVAKAVTLRDRYNPRVLLIGNGDALSLHDAKKKAAEHNADGVMLGRAIFGNPWLFHPEQDLSNVSPEKRFETLIEHTHLFEQLLPHKNFAIMKKHYKAYVHGFDGARELRSELMEAKDAAEVERLTREFLVAGNYKNS